MAKIMKPEIKNPWYLEFLRYCIDDAQNPPVSAKGIDWMEMMDWAEQQAIVGVLYGGITDVRGQREDGRGKLQIPFDALMEWIGYGQEIEAQNKLVNQRCVEVVEMFRKEGFESCILKGQGNAMMYPNPLLRTPGDIDVWSLTPNPSPKGEGNDVRHIIEYVRKKNPGAKAGYHHVEYGEFNGVDVEVHYRPTFMNNLILNRKLQRWMDEHKDQQFHNHINLPDTDGFVSVSTWEFNVVFQLTHIYRHVIQSGLGLKQVIDYYYLLRSDPRKRSITGTVPTDSLLRELGLMEIAGAVMWVLKEVLGMEERYLIAPVDERRGRFLLSEIMQGGNFGMNGTQKSRKSQKGCLAWPKWLSADTAIGRNILRLKRDVRLLRYFPSECLWEPIFRIYHFFWRLAH